jgi:mannose-1-phosphate guanylyltransferase/mannose-6-phosphate isomerase
MLSVEAIARGPRYEVNLLVLAPHASTSARGRADHAEHWLVVKGLARITRGPHVFELRENESVFIPRRVKRLLENAGAGPLEVIEVRIGSGVEQDDVKYAEYADRRA